MRPSTIIILCGYLLLSVPLFTVGGRAAGTVQKAQKALKQYGIDPGPLDGVMGPRTRAAVKKFQMDKGLPETGMLGTETQKALGILSVDKPKPSAESSRQPDNRPLSTIGRRASKLPASADVIPAPPGMSDDGVAGDEDAVRLSTIFRLVVLSGLGLAALRPVGWILLTGGSLMTVVMMINWIGGYFNGMAYGVFACAYITPVFCRMIAKSWDMVLLFSLLLGTPVFLISKYAFGFGWLMAGCNGLAVLTLLPEGCRRVFSKRRDRLPYGRRYHRF